MSEEKDVNKEIEEAKEKRKKDTLLNVALFIIANALIWTFIHFHLAIPAVVTLLIYLGLYILVIIVNAVDVYRKNPGTWLGILGFIFLIMLAYPLYGATRILIQLIIFCAK